ncbi:GNAT family N-acetyltransferase [Simiduia agarivorans]|uniref:Acetyltransferase n=1 Tax=Simiduia agarivorans (strain DSM 21679 / JCM 13881 / BCRC 17597 / SA1) TaxID=1117647 RepID=K4KZ55_SIMAS|nr:GNAT family N-acetyltransferase [Simiduia agarivorans]AFU99182.1 acetyltransferase [Simiduia agarivorans SA1 = DSM 21679]
MIIEPARASDALAPLIYSSGPAAFDFVFLGQALEFLQSVSDGKGHSFGFDAHTVMRDDKGQAQACISLYTRDQHDARQNANVAAIIRWGSWRSPIMLVRGLRVEKLIPPPPPDSLHVAQLGVAPALRSQGLGAQLLAYAESQARARGIGQLSLDVADENPRARALYERLGFRLLTSQASSIPGLSDHHLLVRPV